MIGFWVGTFAAFVAGLLGQGGKPAGPDWMWRGGREDLIRALYFRADGRFRRYGRPALALTIGGGCAALYWLLGLPAAA